MFCAWMGLTIVCFVFAGLALKNLWRLLVAHWSVPVRLVTKADLDKARRLVDEMAAHNARLFTYVERIAAHMAAEKEYATKLQSWQIRSACLERTMFRPALH